MEPQSPTPSADRSDPAANEAEPTDDIGVDMSRDYRWLPYLWAFAVLFHLAGNSFFIDIMLDGGFTDVAMFQVVVAAAAVAVLAKPNPATAVILAALFIWVTWLKSPRIGNHEVLLALVAAGLLVSAIAHDRKWLNGAVAGLRAMFVIAYGAMAFSKLNEGFLSLESSCAVVFGDELGRLIGVQASANSTLAWASIYIALAVELAIPVLLVVRRWRNFGVLLGLVFHTVLALDPVSHVFDFTSILAPMFLLFADEEVQRDLSAGLNRLAALRSGRGLATFAALAVIGHGVILALGWPPWLIAYPLWLALMIWIIRLVATRLWVQRRETGTMVAERFGSRLALPLVPIVILAAVNALSPYLQVRTAAGFNMYSNLETVISEPNHLVFGAGIGIRDVDLVEIVEAPEDHPLAYYVDRNLGIPVENLRFYRANIGSSQDEEVVLRWLGAESDGQPTRLGDLEPADMGWVDTVVFRLTYRRSVDLHSPARCLREWGPVG